MHFPQSCPVVILQIYRVMYGTKDFDGVSDINIVNTKLLIQANPLLWKIVFVNNNYIREKLR